ncbi:glycosyltransferase family 4 protein [Methylobrevis pamukkalensis]|uniref:glycosyltransferase family 4 protein n=1 Tax=Methylobrevis pamukkalensis TaxID=1439726 RepID=UPI000845D69A|nr:glycosyltransferase family 4 protein [Methylobrevis pamukkalensis]
MKTVAYVLNEFPVLSETFIGNEIRAMAKRGHRIVPIVLHRPRTAGQPDDRLLANEAVYLDAVPGHLVAAGALTGLPFGRRRLLAAAGFLRAQTSLDRRQLFGDAMKIAAIAARHRCSHVHAHFADAATSAAIVAARWMGRKVSFVCHGREIYTSPQDLALKLESADFVVSVSADLTRDLINVTPLPLIATIPYATDPTYFHTRYDVEDNGRLLFIGGHLNVHKGLDDLICALELLAPRRLMLDVVGDGPYRPYLEQLSDIKAPGMVRFLGSRPMEWIKQHGPDYLGLVGPFKVAADGSRDTGPIVVKEAMAMGLPVVASRFMGLKETVTDETGFMYEPGDIEQLAAAIRRLVDLPTAQRRAMGEAGRQRVIAHFTLDAQAEALSDLIETM